MKKILQIFALLFLLLNSFIAFATDASGEIEDTPEDPETPINTRLLWLLIAGVAFAFYYFYNQRKKQISK
jgi:Zn-dependent protease with chaperone function